MLLGGARLVELRLGRGDVGLGLVVLDRLLVGGVGRAHPGRGLVHLQLQGAVVDAVERDPAVDGVALGELGLDDPPAHKRGHLHLVGVDGARDDHRPGVDGRAVAPPVPPGRAEHDEHHDHDEGDSAAVHCLLRPSCVPRSPGLAHCVRSVRLLLRVLLEGHVGGRACGQYHLGVVERHAYVQRARHVHLGRRHPRRRVDRANADQGHRRRMALSREASRSRRSPSRPPLGRRGVRAGGRRRPPRRRRDGCSRPERRR